MHRVQIFELFSQIFKLRITLCYCGFVYSACVRIDSNIELCCQSVWSVASVLAARRSRQFCASDKQWLGSSVWRLIIQVLFISRDNRWEPFQQCWFDLVTVLGQRQHSWLSSLVRGMLEQCRWSLSSDCLLDGNEVYANFYRYWMGLRGCCGRFIRVS